MKRQFVGQIVLLLAPWIHSFSIEQIPAEVRHWYVQACLQSGGKWLDEGIRIEDTLLEKNETEEYRFVFQCAFSLRMYDLVERWFLRYQQTGQTNTLFLTIVETWKLGDM